MDAQGWIIAVLCLMLFGCLVKMWQAKQERPLYRAECQEKFMELQVQFAKAIEAHELQVSAAIAKLEVRHTETQRLRDKRDADRDRRLADMELVLKTRLRFQP